MRRVLVTDAEQRSALAVVRSLGRAGHHVEVCAATSRPMAGASKHAAAEHLVTDPATDSDGFVDELERLVRERGFDTLVPMTDVSASVALGMRARLPELVIPMPPADVWSEVADKGRLVEVAREVGVAVPRQVVVERLGADLAPAIEFANGVGWPIVVKPHRSAVVGPRGVRKFGVSMAADADALARTLGALDPGAFPVLVQERVQGPGLGGFFLAIGGEVVASFAHERIREKPPTGGVSVLREAVPLRDDVRRASEALLERFGWSGVAMVEFKEDATTGTPYLMEINGRFWGSLQLAIDAGVDFPGLLIERFSHATVSADEGRPVAVEPYRVGVRSRWFWGDVDHLVWLLRAPAGYRDDHPELPGRSRALARFLIPWSPGTRYEVFRLTDLKPFLRETRQWWADVLRRR